MGTVEKLYVNQRMVQWDGSVGEGVELTVRAKTALVDAYIGCSIAVNGVCLTAISYDQETVREIFTLYYIASAIRPTAAKRVLLPLLSRLLSSL
jgi:riboflavin synthase